MPVGVAGGGGVRGGTLAGPVLCYAQSEHVELTEIGVIAGEVAAIIGGGSGGVLGSPLN